MGKQSHRDNTVVKKKIELVSASWDTNVFGGRVSVSPSHPQPPRAEEVTGYPHGSYSLFPGLYIYPRLCVSQKVAVCVPISSVSLDPNPDSN